MKYWVEFHLEAVTGQGEELVALGSLGVKMPSMLPP